VVVGQGWNVDWHHLDDDVTHSSFVNLVPLGRDFNLNLRDLRKRPDTPLRPDLNPDNLLRRAALHFSHWEIALACGAARLSTFVGRLYLQWSADRQVPSVVATLYYARNRTDYDLIADLLTRDLSPLIDLGSLSRRSQASILKELASLFTEHGHAKEAVELYELVDNLLPIAEVDSPREFGALLRRRFMTAGAASGWSNQREAEAGYKHALESDPSENLAASVGNSRAWTYIDQREFGQAYDVLLPLFQKYRHKAFTPGGALEPVDVTIWNIAEIMHGFSVAAFGAHGRKGLALGREAFRKAAEAYHQYGLRPYVVREGFLSPTSPIRMRYTSLENLSFPSRESLPLDLYDQAIMLARRTAALI
jgi:tetratricopeptide (TPR) repeat protein